MRIIIIEDEKLAVEHLQRLLQRYDPSIELLAQLPTVSEAILWFQNNEAPDLAFFDIQLADGLSFEILEQINVPCPIIFTTAYDEYTLKAFKVNSIDYLLKPVDLEEITQAIEKFKQLQTPIEATQIPSQVDAIRLALQMIQKDYKTRFLIKSGTQLTSVPVEEIAYFYHENKLLWLKTKTQKKHALDYTLDQLQELLDPKQFFRLNRKYIADYNSIQQVISYSNSRLKVVLKDLPKDEQILISRDRVNAFKAWLDG